MVNKIKPIILLLTVLSITSCGFSKNNEIEPNNTFAKATKVELNQEYSGSLENEDDIDNYVVNISENLTLRIELSGLKGINDAFTVYKMDGSSSLVLKFVDDNRKSSPEAIANLHVSPGVYIISVHHGERDEKKGNPEIRYSLKIMASESSLEEYEPNDDPENANRLYPDTPLKGYFSPSRNSRNNNEKTMYREDDWYSFEITADEDNPVIINLALSGVEGVDSVLELYDSSLNKLDQSDSSGPGGGESFNGYGLRKSGVYYAVVASKNFQYNHNQSYQILLTTGIYERGSELEPDNSFEQAFKLISNEVNGMINYNNDTDYYSFIPQEKCNYRIEVINDENSDTVLTVFSLAQKKLFEINSTGAGGVETIPDIFIREQVYLVVTSAVPVETECRYKLVINPVNSVLPMEIEPNNTKNEATLLSGRVRGYTTFNNDVDYYQIKNDTRKNYKINFIAPLNGSVKISTTDQLGYIIKTRELKNGESVSFNEIFEIKGYIIIDTVSVDSDNAYELDVEEIQ